MITGIAKGRKLKSPRGLTTRPTTDRVKESLFNILGQTVVGADILDLFAGSGAIGIEALSRGAKSAIFIEKDPQAIKAIKDNIEITGLTDQAQIYRNDVFSAMVHLAGKKLRFNMIFLDPPYLKNYEAEVLNKVHTNKLLEPDGIVVVEHSKLDKMPERVGDIQRYREEKYGDTVLTFYNYKMLTSEGGN